ncbi:MAG: hypothetical protein L7F77_14635 [Candidatus Magnetominusculus sp. LBB02]|nr:hypothetical protein [Candidatus Magnetominusculus sp. LBB02]
MSVITIPRSIRERLGDAASEDFAGLINDIDLGARKDAIAIAEERFERRLVEESGKLRLEIEKLRTGFEGRLVEESGNLRLEIEKLRTETRLEIGKVWLEIEKVRTEVEKSGKENIKWMFLFWVGQIAAVAALLKFFIK